MIIMTETTGSIIPTATRQCTSHGVHNKYINVQSAAEFRLFFDAADIDRPLLAGGLVCLSVCLSQIGMWFLRRVDSICYYFSFPSSTSVSSFFTTPRCLSVWGTPMTDTKSIINYIKLYWSHAGWQAVCLENEMRNRRTTGFLINRIRVPVHS